MSQILKRRHGLHFSVATGVSVVEKRFSVKKAGVFLEQYFAGSFHDFALLLSGRAKNPVQEN